MNENKFDAKGNVYSKARPTYPEALFWYLLSERIIDKEKVVADIGSGTGIFTTQLSPYVNSIVAVEPNEDMRLKAEDKFKTFSNITSLRGTAENTSLPDNSVDLITVAQAFHWFDRKSFKAECKRILKPNGKILLVWNDRDATSEIIRDNFKINSKFCADFKGSSNGIDFSKSSFSDFFEGEFDLIEFDNCYIYDLDSFLARNLSSSYSPKSSDDNYQKYIMALVKVFDKHCESRKVRYPYITRCFLGNV